MGKPFLMATDLEPIKPAGEIQDGQPDPNLNPMVIDEAVDTSINKSPVTDSGDIDLLRSYEDIFTDLNNKIAEIRRKIGMT